jgi:hypothetical protein
MSSQTQHIRVVLQAAFLFYKPKVNHLNIKQSMSYKLFKNISSLVVCTSALGLSYYEQYELVYSIIFTYVTADLFYSDEFDIRLHHYIVICFITSIIGLPPAEYLLEARTIVNVEISTIFLALNNLIRDKHILVPSSVVSANKILFALTFTKYRIWDFYWVFITRRPFPSDITMASLYSLFLLNTYWFCLICRKACGSKPRILNPVHKDQKTLE